MSAPGSSSSVQWKHSDYLDSALFLEFDKCRVDDVCARVEGNLYSCEECEYAMKALAVQAYTAVKSGDAILVAEFLDCMACECIILSLKKHAARSQQVATYALSCIVCLSSYSLDLNEYFTELEAMDIILFTISMHMGDEYVSELGTAAAVQLAAAAIRNSSALADGCDIMSQVGVFGLNLRNKRAAYVAMNICYVYSLLAQAVNVKKLVDCGACDLIVTLVRAHESNIDIVVPGTVALCNLASLSFETREALGACGACSLAPRLMRRHPRCVPVLLGGCELIMHLALSPSNTAPLAEADACSLLLLALETHLLAEPYGAEVCCSAALHMASVGLGAPAQRIRLLELGAERAMSSVLASAKSSHRAKDYASQLQELLRASRSRSNSTVSVSSTSSATSSSVSHASASKASLNSLAYPSGGPHGNNVKFVNTSKNVFVFGSRITADTNRPLAVEIREYESFSAVEGERADGDAPALVPVIGDEATATRRIVEL